MNFFIMVSLFLSAALGVFRGIDLALLTDALHAFRGRGTGGGCLLWPGRCAACLLDGEQRGNAYPGCAGGAVRVLDDRSRPELAAEGLEDPHPQPDARRAGQRRVLLVRALYLPGTSDGRTLCAGGLAAFALCLCWELPTVLQTLVQEGGGALLTPTLLFRLGLCCVGALGALSAVRCTRTEQDA